MQLHGDQAASWTCLPCASGFNALIPIPKQLCSPSRWSVKKILSVPAADVAVRRLIVRYTRLSQIVSLVALALNLKFVGRNVRQEI